MAQDVWCRKKVTLGCSIEDALRKREAEGLQEAVTIVLGRNMCAWTEMVTNSGRIG